MKCNNGKCTVLHLRKNNPKYQCNLGAGLLENSSEEKDLGVLVENKFNHELAMCPSVQEITVIQGCIKKSVTSMSSEVLLSIYSGEASSVQFWAPQFKKDLELLNKGQQRHLR